MTASVERAPIAGDGNLGAFLSAGELLLGRRDAGAAIVGAHLYVFGGDGGATGPDLTMAAGRFGFKDLADATFNPSKVISDQYAAVQVVTTEGKVVVGRIVNLSGDTYHINTNMLDPNAMEDINRANIEEMGPAKSSMMPNGLLNTLKDDELLDLMAFLLSRGDRKNVMFSK